MRKLVRGLYNLRPYHRGGIVTIGNFDGVHLGHQAVIEQLTAKAAALQRPSLMIIFEPSPREYFAPESAPARLTRLRERCELLRSSPVDWLLCLRFNRALASMEAEEFIRVVLVEKLGIRCLITGDDFRFGRGRRGDFALLQRAGKHFGFEVIHRRTFYLEGERVSSTRVRSALARGELDEAEKLLGRPYSVSGRIVPGDRRGRTLGFPTANMDMHRRRAPLSGIFVVEVYGLEAAPLPGVANVGVRPTVGGERFLLETYLFNFNRDIYGCYVRVVFLQQLRQEEHFESLTAMRRQIAQDCRAARDFFAIG